MFREVRTQDSKKLFEWNSEKRVVSIVGKRKLYLCRLGDNDEFTCISEADKPSPKLKTK
ncbi:MAG: hypothetical protein FWE04_04650 [Oscillospiraceae bacterium]|nr:hypothetical protein [Oscillospiraceae bacterium]